MDASHGSRLVGELFLHVLREVPVLHRLPDEDKPSLAATCWTALERVLRDTRAVLRVHPEDPVLGVLAQRLAEGPCDGSVTLCGIQVPATDAGALLAASSNLGCDLPTSIADPFKEADPHDTTSEEETRAWTRLVKALAEGPGGAHVTGLTLPTLRDRQSVTREAQGVAEALRTRAVKDNLRSLKAAAVGWSSWPQEVEGLLHDALRGLSSLRHLELCNTPPSWGCLVDQYSCLTAFELRQSRDVHVFDARDWGLLLDAVEKATTLRSLKLHVGKMAFSQSGELPPRGLPAGLEVLVASREVPVRWWEATDLRSLELERCPLSGHVFPDWGLIWAHIAELVSNSEQLQRLVIGDFWEYGASQYAIPFFWALEQSTVEQLILTCPVGEPGQPPSKAMTAAVVSAARNNAGLRELALRAVAGQLLGGLDQTAVVQALLGNTSLRKLRLEWGPETTDGVGAALGTLLRCNTSLVELELIPDEWGPEGFDELLQGLGENRTLQVLRISSVHGLLGGGRSVDGPSRLMYQLYGGNRHEGRQLHTLEMCVGNVGRYGLENIAAVLEEQRSCRLQRLALTHVPATSGVEAIARALRRNRWLLSLELALYTDVRGTQDVCEQLAQSLVDNTTLRHLKIRGYAASLDRVPLAKRLLHAQRFAIALRQAPARGP